jgi:N-acylneuraminate cytidylyltransferase
MRIVNIAVVPARGGSRRIPRKNIRPFCGKPMMAWTLEAARGSGLFDRVIVSTEDAEIKQVALQWGAECPFDRPAALANDYADTGAVMAHATEWAIEAGWPVDTVCCIYATAPFVDQEDLKRGLDALRSGDWAFSVAATECGSAVFRSFRQREDGGLEMLFPEYFSVRSQDLPRALQDAGQFYWGRPSAWIEKRRVFERRSIPVLIPKWRVQDIDEPDDWRRAEMMFRYMRSEANSPAKAGRHDGPADAGRHVPR